MEPIRNRQDIPQKDKWAIEDLYPSDADWEKELETLDADAEKLASYNGQLGRSGQMLYEYLLAMEQLNVKADRLGNYCMRRADEDTRDSACQAMTGQFISKAVAIGAACSFDTPQIMALPEQTLEGFYQDCPELERYRRYLTDLRRRKEHTLSEQEEKLLAAAGEMAQAPDAIYGAFADADLKFPDAVDAQGQPHPLTQGTFVLLEESRDRQLRRSAYENMYDTLAGYANTTAAVLNAQNRQLKFFSDARRYGSALEASLDANNVPTAVYDNLIETVHRNLDKMHRYVRLRKAVSIGAPGSGVYFNAIDVLAAAGLTENDIKAQYQSFADSTDALKDGKIDAAFIVAGAPTAAITELCTTNDAFLVPIDGEIADKLMADSPYYTSYTVPAGTYAGQDADVATVTVKATMIVSASADEEQVYNLTKAIFDNADAIAAENGKGAELSVENATSGMAAPFHPGAAKYFAEKGTTVETA